MNTKLMNELAATAGFGQAHTVAGGSLSWKLDNCRVWDSNGRGEWCVAFENADGTLEQHTYFHDLVVALNWARQKLMERLGYTIEDDIDRTTVVRTDAFVKSGVRRVELWYDLERKQWAAGQFSGWSGLTDVQFGTFADMLAYAERIVDDAQWHDETDDEGNFLFANGDMYDYVVFVDTQRGGLDLVVGYDVRPDDSVEMAVPQGVETVEQAKAFIEAYMRKEFDE